MKIPAALPPVLNETDVMTNGRGLVVGVTGRRASVTYECGRNGDGKLEGSFESSEASIDKELIVDRLSLFTEEGERLEIVVVEHDAERAAFVSAPSVRPPHF